MRIELQIDIQDKRLGTELFAPATTVGPGTTAQAPGDAALELREWYFRKGAGFHDTLTIILSATKDLGVALFASWLYDKLKGGRAKALRINRTEVQIDQGAIRKIVTEQVKRDE